MKPCSLLALAGLLVLNRCDAHGSSLSSASHAGAGQLSPDFQPDFQSSLAQVQGSGGPRPRAEAEVWIEVKASSANSPTPAAPGALNVLTIAIRARQEAIWSIDLRLPERQICEGDSGVCYGYEFSEAEDSMHECDIAPWPYDDLELPKSGLAVIDVQKRGLIDGCTVNNTYGNYGPSERKRSQLLMTFRQDAPGHAPEWLTGPAQLTNTWLVFKIKVRNPAETPMTRPDAKYLANTWQVILHGKGGMLGTRVLAAPKILPLWTCAYSNWMWTAPCTARCGGGVRYAVRRLLHPPPQTYPPELLVNCNGNLSQTHKCNENHCNVDCSLGDWTPFADGACSATCGKGFEVQRRRVVEGPIGKGKLCPGYNEHEVRVRYRDCEGTGECTPRCEVAGKEDAEPIYGACSSTCDKDKGSRSVLPIVIRKEPGATTCQAQSQELECGTKCTEINFFPGGPGKLPRVGKWFEIVMVFFLSNNAQGLVLEAPEGFDIGKTDEDKCLIKFHNIPRLKGCRVLQTEDKRVNLKIDLFNVLEPMLRIPDGKTRQPEFQVRFYVKSPAKCLEGFNAHGACKVPCKTFNQEGVCNEHAWTWNLRAWNREGDETSEELNKGSFEVYNDHAKEWHSPEEMKMPVEGDKMNELADFAKDITDDMEDNNTATE